MLEEINLIDLKKLNYEQLDSLAKEIREEIITVVSRNGGHLASNLGIVELTIALHMVFESPKDKIIFDVSHQSYAHKILTGRYKNFESLRKFKGISGFMCGSYTKASCASISTWKKSSSRPFICRELMIGNGC